MELSQQTRKNASSIYFMFSRTLIIAFLVLSFAGAGFAPQVFAGHCVDLCGGAGSIHLPCYEICLLTEDTSNILIADDCVGTRTIEPRSGWTFEGELGLPVLFGFDPSEGLQIFGWLVVAMLSLATVLALVTIAYGGIRYISSAGSSSGQTAARSRINNALFGLFLALFAVASLGLISESLTTIGEPRSIDSYFSAVDEKGSRPDGACDAGSGDAGSGDTGSDSDPTPADVGLDSDDCTAGLACSEEYGYGCKQDSGLCVRTECTTNSDCGGYVNGTCTNTEVPGTLYCE